MYGIICSLEDMSCSPVQVEFEMSTFSATSCFCIRILMAIHVNGPLCLVPASLSVYQLTTVILNIKLSDIIARTILPKKRSIETQN